MARALGEETIQARVRLVLTELGADRELGAPGPADDTMVHQIVKEIL